MPTPNDRKKLTQLARDFRFPTVTALLDYYANAPRVVGICKIRSCNGWDLVLPNESGMRCNKCGRDTIKSCFVLAGVL